MSNDDRLFSSAAGPTEEDPTAILRSWLREAAEAGEPLPERACLATVSAAGRPAARMVLVKSVTEDALRFFTDYRSRKADELTAVPHAALVFYWHRLGRQVRVEGATRRSTGEASDRYFATRSRGSRISAWASSQSAAVGERSELERRWQEIARRFADGDVTRPEHWGGFEVRPSLVEFWRERQDRLHDRIAFERDSSGWVRSKLQP